MLCTHVCLRVSYSYAYAVVSVLSTTPNNITLTWSEADIVGDTNTIIRWKRSNLCSMENTVMSITSTMSNITIAELEEYSSYNITVSIGNISDSVIVMTNESGNSYHVNSLISQHMSTQSLVNSRMNYVAYMTILLGEWE